MEPGLTDCRAVFHGATILALRDGQLSNGEKRLLVKLAHAFKLEEVEPKHVYDTVVNGENLGAGREIGRQEMRLVYEQVLEAVHPHRPLRRRAHHPSLPASCLRYQRLRAQGNHKEPRPSVGGDNPQERSAGLQNALGRHHGENR